MIVLLSLEQVRLDPLNFFIIFLPSLAVKLMVEFASHYLYSGKF
jgi:hypothetical protein